MFIHSPCNQPVSLLTNIATGPDTQHNTAVQDKAKRSTFDRVILNNKEDKAFKLLTAALTAVSVAKCKYQRYLPFWATLSVGVMLKSFVEQKSHREQHYYEYHISV